MRFGVSDSVRAVFSMKSKGSIRVRVSSKVRF